MKAWWARCLILGFGLLAPVATLAAGVTVDREGEIVVDPARGVDPEVDYAALARIGPWDDRNYGLTRDDLAWLADHEEELREPLPAFFRVALRKARPGLAPDRPVRYPMHALNVFRQRFGGYLVDGEYYRGVARRDGRYLVDRSSLVPSPAVDDGTDAASQEYRVTNPERAAEAAMAIDPTDSSRVVAGTMGPGQGQRMHYSTDGGETWTLTDLPFGGTCCDPSVAWSSGGGFAYATTLGNCGVAACELYFYRSSDGGVTWTDLETIPPAPGNPRRTVSISADREFLHVDQHTASPYVDRVYASYHEDGTMHVAWSTDFGGGWDAQALSSADDELGAAGDITTDRAGSVYYAWPAYNSRTIRVRKSTDGAATFGTSTVVATTEAAFSFPIPAQESRDVRLYVSAAADLTGGPFADAVYLAWNDATATTSLDPALNHARIRVAYSRDGGQSWSVTTPHETSDEQSVDRFHPALVVGPDGTVHVVYYDTRNQVDRTALDLYYAFSTDGAATWSAPARVTSVTSPNILDGFEYGDYNALDMVTSRLVAAFADNRNENGEPVESTDVYAAVIPAGGGAGRIPGARDVAGSPLTIGKNANGTDLDLAWDAACGAGDDYAVYAGDIGTWTTMQSLSCSTSGLTSTTITPAGGDRFYLVVARNGGVEGSYGRDGTGAERSTAGAAACGEQVVGACP